MTTEHIHTCSYSCDRPECIRQQRDELAARLIIIGAWFFTAADMADQGARQFEAGYAAAKAELHAAAQEVTPEMVAAAEEAYMPFGDMELALNCALAARPRGVKDV